MQDKLRHSWRSPFIFMLLVAMLAGLFFSRALLSASMAGLLIVSFFHTSPRQHLAAFFSSPLYWGMSLLFFVPFISGAWSGDQQRWLEIGQVKLPLLIMPLAFAGPHGLKKKDWNRLAVIFTGFVTAGTAWSLIQYLPDAASVNAGYLQAGSIVTPLENDHVRFSWMVAVAILAGGWLFVSCRGENRFTRIVLIIVVLWLILFLHILAARTGLFSFYFMLGGTAAWLIIKKTKRAFAVVMILILGALPFLAYKTIPSFQNRVKYVIYDSGFFTRAHYWPRSTDAVRVISLKAGWALMNEYPFSGVGAGDLMEKTRQWYDAHYPGMEAADKIYPSSEWLVYGAGAGWPGFLVFSFCMLVPFFIPTRQRLPWWLLNATAAGSFLFDIGLEVQYGVCIYSLLVLSWQQWMKEEKS